jgi:adenylylsulfate kinase
LKPFILWLMGPTSAGKTTLAIRFVEKWRQRELPVMHFDGDEVRDFFGPDHGFGLGDRLRVGSTLVFLAQKANEAGVSVVISALTAHQDARSLVAEELPEALVGYVECSIDQCAERDPKGLYARAKAGEIDTVVGWNTEYVPPAHADLVLNTENASPDALFEKTDRFLAGR